MRHLEFTPPYGELCDGCALIEESLNRLESKDTDTVVLSCAAVATNTAYARVRGTEIRVDLNADNPVSTGTTTTITGACQTQSG